MTIDTERREQSTLRIPLVLRKFLEGDLPKPEESRPATDLTERFLGMRWNLHNMVKGQDYHPSPLTPNETTSEVARFEIDGGEFFVWVRHTTSTSHFHGHTDTYLVESMLNQMIYPLHQFDTVSNEIRNEHGQSVSDEYGVRKAELLVVKLDVNIGAPSMA